MTTIQKVKMAGSLIISVGVGAIVGNAVRITTPPVGLVKGLCITVGGFVLSSMVADKTVEYAEEKVDSFINEIKKEMAEKVEVN